MSNATPAAPPVGAIVHHDYFSSDPAATQKFFERLFGWKFQSFDESYALFEGPAGTTGGVGKPMMPSQPPSSLNYVLVESLAETVKKAKAEGAQIIMERQEVPNMGALAVFIVPGGIPHGIWEPAPGAQQPPSA